MAQRLGTPASYTCFLFWSLGQLVPGQATAALLSIQVPAPSPGYSSSAGLPACRSVLPTASSGPRSHLPAPSRKCGLSLPSWARRPPAQVCWVPATEGIPPAVPRHHQDLALSPCVPFLQATAPGWS